MRTRYLLIFAGVAGLSLSAIPCPAQQPVAQTTSPAAVSASMDDSVTAYRKIIVLAADVREKLQSLP